VCQLELVPFLPEPLGYSKGTEIVKVKVQARYGTCTVKERCGLVEVLVEAEVELEVQVQLNVHVLYR
jgi:hypothetical protein